jgi:hypothetical protein
MATKEELLETAAKLKIDGAEKMDKKQLEDQIEIAEKKAAAAEKAKAETDKKSSGEATGIKALVTCQHKGITYKAGEEIRNKEVASQLVKEKLAK